MSNQVPTLKLVIIGDSVGKSSILFRYLRDDFNEKYTPTVFETQDVEHVVDDITVDLRIFDTSGQEEYEQIRKGAYNATDVLFIAFSIVKRDSFLNIKRLWLREQKRFMPKVKIVLLGTKCDLKEADSSLSEELKKVGIIEGKMVTEAEGKALAKKIGAVGYLETSAKTGDGVKDAFDTAVRAGLGLLEPDSSCCQS